LNNPNQYGGGRNIRIAVPIWEKRISPVFDSAHSISITDILGGEVKSRFIISLQGNNLLLRALKLSRWRVEVLICGGISSYLQRLLIFRGIRVIPGIRGRVDEAVKAFCRGTITSAHYLMPGWRGR